MSAFTQSQVYKTNPNPYDQIIVLSQATINESFANMWAIAPDDSPLLSFAKTQRDGQYINGTLAAPRISLQAQQRDLQLLYYYLNFDSGTLKLYVSDDSNDSTMTEFDISGWIICFPVRICIRFFFPH